MATTTCSQCNASYPSLLKTCPSCKAPAGGPLAGSEGIKKVLPLIVALDLVIIGGFLLYFFVLR
ncbi:hypothetical protein D3C86_520650 [compost metagenome]